MLCGQIWTERAVTTSQLATTQSPEARSNSKDVIGPPPWGVISTKILPSSFEHKVALALASSRSEQRTGSPLPNVNRTRLIIPSTASIVSLFRTVKNSESSIKPFSKAEQCCLALSAFAFYPSPSRPCPTAASRRVRFSAPLTSIRHPSASLRPGRIHQPVFRLQPRDGALKRTLRAAAAHLPHPRRATRRTLHSPPHRPIRAQPSRGGCRGGSTRTANPPFARRTHASPDCANNTGHAPRNRRRPESCAPRTGAAILPSRAG